MTRPNREQYLDAAKKILEHRREDTYTKEGVRASESHKFGHLEKPEAEVPAQSAQGEPING